MVQSTKANGKTIYVKAKEYKCTAMETSTKATGRMTSVMAMDGFFTLMVKCITANGSMIWQMELASIKIRTDLRIAASGKTTSKMAPAWNIGQMVISFREIMSKALKKAEVCSNGPMETPTKAALLTTTLKAKASIDGGMEHTTKGPGKQIK